MYLSRFILQGFSVKQPNGPSHVQWQGHWPPGGCPHIAEGEHSHIANTMSHLLAIHAAWHAGKVCSPMPDCKECGRHSAASGSNPPCIWLYPVLSHA